MKLILLAMFYSSLLITSSKMYMIDMIEVLPVQCNDNPYLEKVLDAIRYVESSNGKYVLNVNKNKKGKEISRDEGPYQHNNKCMIIFANCYNDGKRYNPYDEDIARRITRQLILDNYNYLGNWFEAFVAYNCGIGNYINGKAPHSSYQFASKIMKRIKNTP